MKQNWQGSQDQQVQLLPTQNEGPTLQQRIEQAEYAEINQLSNFNPSIIGVSKTNML